DHRPKGLDAETEAEMKIDYKGRGYMTMVLFQDWLTELDAATLCRGDSNSDKAKQLRVVIGDVDKDHEMDQLKEELMVLYPGRAQAIRRQMDFGVLAYLKCCEGKGPNQQLVDAIKIVANSEKFKRFFLPPGSVIMVDEDQEDDEALSDTGYFPPNGGEGPSKVRMQTRRLMDVDLAHTR
ncbi:hypothetical protein BGZ58_003512, partial [Dissophora ornata]